MTGFAPQPAILAPLRVKHFREKIGSAVWLYVHLLAASNDRGVALSRLDRLAEDLHASETEVQEWLGVLHGAGLIEPTTPPPFLVIRLHFWPGETRDAAKSAAPNSYSSQAIHESESKSSNSSYSGPANEALLTEIIEVLGESDPEPFRPVLDLYDVKVIKAALERVRAAGEIRKSKTALFRFLLRKLTKPHVSS